MLGRGGGRFGGWVVCETAFGVGRLGTGSDSGV